MLVAFVSLPFRFIIILMVCTGVGCATSAVAFDQQSFGSFSPGEPTVKLINFDPTKIELEEDFSFKDEAGRIWFVPKSYVFDGASIPQAFWSFVGGPLDGKYLKASIIHDYFCDRRSHDWTEVHKVFYNGMRAAGVGERKAWVMYKAVYYFGPRWTKKIEIPKECKAGPDFSPDDCVINSAPVFVPYKNPLNEKAFNNFVAELRHEGYGIEADELKRSVKLP